MYIQLRSRKKCGKDKRCGSGDIYRTIVKDSKTKKNIVTYARTSAVSCEGREPITAMRCAASLI